MLYPYRCGYEACPSFGKDVDISKPVKDSSRPEACEACGQEMERVYSFSRAPEFKPFYDEQYQTVITSAGQEKRLMKQHGHIDAHDLLSKKYSAQIKNAKWKRKHGFAEHGAARRSNVW